MFMIIKVVRLQSMIISRLMQVIELPLDGTLMITVSVLAEIACKKTLPTLFH